MPDGQVVYKIKGDNSPFQETVAQTASEAEKGYSKIKSIGAGAFKAIGAASVASLGAATAAISGAVKGTAELASYGDNIDTDVIIPARYCYPFAICILFLSLIGIQSPLKSFNDILNALKININTF